MLSSFNGFRGSVTDVNIPLVICAGGDEGTEVSTLGFEQSDDNRSLSDGQTCNISDFYIYGMIIASLPFEGSVTAGNITENIPDHKSLEPSILYDVANQYMILPYLEDIVKSSNTDDVKSCEEVMIDENNTSSFYPTVEQRRSCNQEESIANDSDQVDDFDPHSFIKSLPELSDVVASFDPNMVSKGSQSRKEVTLVLDLDGMWLFAAFFFVSFSSTSLSSLSSVR